MSKTAKKLSAVLVAFVLTLQMVPTAAFAASYVVPSQYSSTTRTIKGTVDLSNVVSASGQDLTRDGQLYYEGTIGGSVEASDLFSGAYDKYVTNLKGKHDALFRYYENIVMFDKNEEFPTARFTIDFPDNFVVDTAAITATENTATISSITKNYDDSTNSVTFVFKLGNWNDYKGFFELYESEMGTTGHAVTLNVPYSVALDSPDATNLGTVSAVGNCALYKYGRLMFGTQIVDVTTTPLNFTVTR